MRTGDRDRANGEEPRSPTITHLQQASSGRSFALQLLIVLVLLATAQAYDGSIHGLGHWIVLSVYAGASILLALLSLRTAPGTGIPVGPSRAWLGWGSTLLNASVAIYVLVEHMFLGAADTEEAAAAVSRIPAFLILLQTALTMRVWHTCLFAGLVTAGWGGAILFVYLSPESQHLGPHVTLDEEVPGLLTFMVASLVVLDGVRRLTWAVAATFRLERERLILTRFVPAAVAEDLAQGGGPGEVQERHACLFALDIRGFSALTRTRPPQQVVEVLMEMRALTHRAVTERGGIVDKYIGDGVLAQFLVGPPQAQARAAFTCAEAVQLRLAALNRRLAEKGLPSLRVTIALHAGDVLVGVFDDGHRAEFTVLGPAMNTLARIEARAKAVDLPIAISEDFRDLLAGSGASGLNWISAGTVSEASGPRLYAVAR
ncbi:adenylate/guanylate cyclase domain-containing protein [Methylobacterium sp. 88A]|uniref:adenylate/guanylate cyclase domain-containing protein n=1 Tax=Methylobacterium sp. 88A TaxID=1131813 RepID=UPI00039ED49F|nr:adenylate/guanylate cyclase domain-containing protein [Methylobacterium sp. 88A]